jgi:hypothetical protein
MFIYIQILDFIIVYTYMYFALQFLTIFIQF